MDNSKSINNKLVNGGLSDNERMILIKINNNNNNVFPNNIMGIDLSKQILCWSYILIIILFETTR